MPTASESSLGSRFPRAPSFTIADSQVGETADYPAEQAAVPVACAIHPADRDSEVKAPTGVESALES
jgi:hypothetical protein